MAVADPSQRFTIVGRLATIVGVDEAVPISAPAVGFVTPAAEIEFGGISLLQLENLNVQCSPAAAPLSGRVEVEIRGFEGVPYAPVAFFRFDGGGSERIEVGAQFQILTSQMAAVRVMILGVPGGVFNCTLSALAVPSRS